MGMSEENNLAGPVSGLSVTGSHPSPSASFQLRAQFGWGKERGIATSLCIAPGIRGAINLTGCAAREEVSPPCLIPFYSVLSWLEGGAGAGIEPVTDSLGVGTAAVALGRQAAWLWLAALAALGSLCQPLEHAEPAGRLATVPPSPDLG